jgi:nicotinate-nucleotide adenylyltransferase
MPMKIALFGGTFDPIHRGHLAVAHAAAEAYKLDRIHFVLAETPPHKQAKPITPYKHRLAMLELALEGEERFSASRIEERRTKSRPEANYSIDTVRRFKQAMVKRDKLFFIIGMDSFLQIDKWKEPEALLAECEFIVVSRPGHAKGGANPTFTGKVHLLETVAVNISSTQIREAIAQGSPLEDWVPATVAQYIKRHRLYR